MTDHQAQQRAEIEAITLTDEQIKDAMYEWKLRQFYKERGINVNGHGDIKAREYWAKIELIRENVLLTK
jgi:hypothetical protein